MWVDLVVSASLCFDLDVEESMHSGADPMIYLWTERQGRFFAHAVFLLL